MASAQMFHYFKHEVFGVQGGGGRARLKFDKGAFHFQSRECYNHPCQEADPKRRI